MNDTVVQLKGKTVFAVNAIWDAYDPGTAVMVEDLTFTINNDAFGSLNAAAKVIFNLNLNKYNEVSELYIGSDLTYSQTFDTLPPWGAEDYAMLFVSDMTFTATRTLVEEQADKHHVLTITNAACDIVMGGTKGSVNPDAAITITFDELIDIVAKGPGGVWLGYAYDDPTSAWYGYKAANFVINGSLTLTSGQAHAFGFGTSVTFTDTAKLTVAKSDLQTRGATINVNGDGAFDAPQIQMKHLNVEAIRGMTISELVDTVYGPSAGAWNVTDSIVELSDGDLGLNSAADARGAKQTGKTAEMNLQNAILEVNGNLNAAAGGVLYLETGSTASFTGNGYLAGAFTAAEANEIDNVVAQMTIKDTSVVTFCGTLTNAGIISVANDATLTVGALDNSGTMTFDGSVFDVNGNLTNTGSISMVLNDSSDPLLIITGVLDNQGTITIDATGFSGTRTVATTGGVSADSNEILVTGIDDAYVFRNPDNNSIFISTEMGSINQYIVDVAYAGKSFGEAVIVGGQTFYYGINAFDTLTGAFSNLRSTTEYIYIASDITENNIVTPIIPLKNNLSISAVDPIDPLNSYTVVWTVSSLAPGADADTLVQFCSADGNDYAVTFDSSIALDITGGTGFTGSCFYVGSLSSGSLSPAEIELNSSLNTNQLYISYGGKLTVSDKGSIVTAGALMVHGASNDSNTAAVNAGLEGGLYATGDGTATQINVATYLSVWGATVSLEDTIANIGTDVNMYPYNDVADNDRALVVTGSTLTAGGTLNMRENALFSAADSTVAFDAVNQYALLTGAAAAGADGGVISLNNSTLTVMDGIAIAGGFNAASASVVSAATLDNTGSIVFTDGSSLTLTGALTNSGTILIEAPIDQDCCLNIDGTINNTGTITLNVTGFDPETFTGIKIIARLNVFEDGSDVITVDGIEDKYVFANPDNNSIYITNQYVTDALYVDSVNCVGKSYAEEVVIGDVTCYYGINAFASLTDAFANAKSSTANIYIADAVLTENNIASPIVTLDGNITVSSLDPNGTFVEWIVNSLAAGADSDTLAQFLSIDENKFDVTFDSSVALSVTAQTGFTGSCFYVGSVASGTLAPAEVKINNAFDTGNLYIAYGGKFTVSADGTVTTEKALMIHGAGNDTNTASADAGIDGGFFATGDGTTTQVNVGSYLSIFGANASFKDTVAEITTDVNMYPYKDVADNQRNLVIVNTKFTAGGTLDLRDNAVVDIMNGSDVSFNKINMTPANGGAATVGMAGGTINVNDSNLTVTDAFQNLDTVNVNASTVAAASLNNSGSFSATASVLDFSAFGNTGDVVLEDSLLSLLGGTFTNDDSIVMSGTSSIIATADFNNAGNVTISYPAPQGTALTVFGTLTNTGSITINANGFEGEATVVMMNGYADGSNKIQVVGLADQYVFEDLTTGTIFLSTTGESAKAFVVDAAYDRYQFAQEIVIGTDTYFYGVNAFSKLSDALLSVKSTTENIYIASNITENGIATPIVELKNNVTISVAEWIDTDSFNVVWNVNDISADDPFADSLTCISSEAGNNYGLTVKGINWDVNAQAGFDGKYFYVGTDDLNGKLSVESNLSADGIYVNKDGALNASGSASVNADTFVNVGSAVLAGSSKLTATSAYNNGVLNASDAAKIDGSTFANSGTINTSKDAIFNAVILNNEGDIIAASSSQIYAADSINNSGSIKLGKNTKFAFGTAGAVDSYNSGLIDFDGASYESESKLVNYGSVTMKGGIIGGIGDGVPTIFNGESTVGNGSVMLKAGTYTINAVFSGDKFSAQAITLTADSNITGDSEISLAGNGKFYGNVAAKNVMFGTGRNTVEGIIVASDVLSQSGGQLNMTGATISASTMTSKTLNASAGTLITVGLFDSGSAVVIKDSTVFADTVNSGTSAFTLTNSYLNAGNAFNANGNLTITGSTFAIQLNSDVRGDFFYTADKSKKYKLNVTDSYISASCFYMGSNTVKSQGTVSGLVIDLSDDFNVYAGSTLTITDTELFVGRQLTQYGELSIIGGSTAAVNAKYFTACDGSLTSFDSIDVLVTNEIIAEAGAAITLTSANVTIYDELGFGSGNMKNSGSLTIDGNSSFEATGNFVNAGTVAIAANSDPAVARLAFGNLWKNTGSITIDMAGATADTILLIQNNGEYEMSVEKYGVTLINVEQLDGSEYTLCVDDSYSLYAINMHVYKDSVCVNQAWEGTPSGTLVKEGYIYGTNAYADYNDAVDYITERQREDNTVNTLYFDDAENVVLSDIGMTFETVDVIFNISGSTLAISSNTGDTESIQSLQNLGKLKLTGTESNVLTVSVDAFTEDDTYGAAFVLEDAVLTIGELTIDSESGFGLRLNNSTFVAGDGLQDITVDELYLKCATNSTVDLGDLKVTGEAEIGFGGTGVTFDANVDLTDADDSVVFAPNSDVVFNGSLTGADLVSIGSGASLSGTLTESTLTGSTITIGSDVTFSGDIDGDTVSASAGDVLGNLTGARVDLDGSSASAVTTGKLTGKGDVDNDSKLTVSNGVISGDISKFAIVDVYGAFVDGSVVENGSGEIGTEEQYIALSNATVTGNFSNNSLQLLESFSSASSAGTVWKTTSYDGGDIIISDTTIEGDVYNNASGDTFKVQNSTIGALKNNAGLEVVKTTEVFASPFDAVPFDSQTDVTYGTMSVISSTVNGVVQGNEFGKMLINGTEIADDFVGNGNQALIIHTRVVNNNGQVEDTTESFGAEITVTDAAINGDIAENAVGKMLISNAVVSGGIVDNTNMESSKDTIQSQTTQTGTVTTIEEFTENSTGVSDGISLENATVGADISGNELGSLFISNSEIAGAISNNNIVDASYSTTTLQEVTDTDLDVTTSFATTSYQASGVETQVLFATNSSVGAVTDNTFVAATFLSSTVSGDISGNSFTGMETSFTSTDINQGTVLKSEVKNYTGARNGNLLFTGSSIDGNISGNEFSGIGIIGTSVSGNISGNIGLTFGRAYEISGATVDACSESATYAAIIGIGLSHAGNIENNTNLCVVEIVDSTVGSIKNNIGGESAGNEDGTVSSHNGYILAITSEAGEISGNTVSRINIFNSTVGDLLSNKGIDYVLEDENGKAFVSVIGSTIGKIFANTGFEFFFKDSMVDSISQVTSAAEFGADVVVDGDVKLASAVLTANASGVSVLKVGGAFAIATLTVEQDLSTLLSTDDAVIVIDYTGAVEDAPAHTIQTIAYNGFNYTLGTVGEIGLLFQIDDNKDLSVVTVDSSDLYISTEWTGKSHFEAIRLLPNSEVVYYEYDAFDTYDSISDAKIIAAENVTFMDDVANLTGATYSFTNDKTFKTMNETRSIVRGTSAVFYIGEDVSFVAEDDVTLKLSGINNAGTFVTSEKLKVGTAGITNSGLMNLDGIGRVVAAGAIDNSGIFSADAVVGAAFSNATASANISGDMKIAGEFNNVGGSVNVGGVLKVGSALYNTEGNLDAATISGALTELDNNNSMLTVTPFAPAVINAEVIDASSATVNNASTINADSVTVNSLNNFDTLNIGSATVGSFSNSSDAITNVSSCIYASTFSNSGEVNFSVTTADPCIIADAFGSVTGDLYFDAHTITGVVKIIDYTGMETMTVDAYKTIVGYGWDNSMIVKDNDLWLAKTNDRNLFVNVAWGTCSFGDDVNGEGIYFYGINAFKSVEDAFDSGKWGNTNIVKVVDSQDTATISLTAGKTYSITGATYGAMLNAGTVTSFEVGSAATLKVYDITFTAPTLSSYGAISVTDAAINMQAFSQNSGTAAFSNASLSGTTLAINGVASMDNTLVSLTDSISLSGTASALSAENTNIDVDNNIDVLDGAQFSAANGTIVAGGTIFAASDASVNFDKVAATVGAFSASNAVFNDSALISGTTIGLTGGALEISSSSIEFAEFAKFGTIGDMNIDSASITGAGTASAVMFDTVNGSITGLDVTAASVDFTSSTVAISGADFDATMFGATNSDLIFSDENSVKSVDLNINNASLEANGTFNVNGNIAAVDSELAFGFDAAATFISTGVIALNNANLAGVNGTSFTAGALSLLNDSTVAFKDSTVNVVVINGDADSSVVLQDSDFTAQTVAISGLLTVSGSTFAAKTITVDTGVALINVSDSVISFSTALTSVNGGYFTADITETEEGQTYKFVDYTGTGASFDFDAYNALFNNKLNDDEFFALDNDLFYLKGGYADAVLYVNRDWAGTAEGDGIEITVPGTTETKTVYFGLDAFASVNTALNNASDDTVIDVLDGDYSGGRVAFKDYQAKVENGAYKNFVGGEYYEVTNATLVEKTGNTNVTINGGVFGSDTGVGIVCGSDYVNRTTGNNCNTLHTGDSTLTINGGNFNCNVLGGVYYYEKNSVHGEVAFDGNINLNICGGTFARQIFGGSYPLQEATPAKITLISSLLRVDGDITITIDASDNAIAINANVFAGNFGAGAVVGNTKVVFTGDSANLTFTRDVSGDSGYAYYDSEGGAVSFVDGTKTISFNAFTGDFNAKFTLFDTVSVTDGSDVNFADHALDSRFDEVSTWEFDGNSGISGVESIDFNGDTFNFIDNIEGEGEKVLIAGVDAIGFMGMSSVTFGDVDGVKDVAAQVWSAENAGFKYELGVDDDSNVVIKKTTIA